MSELENYWNAQPLVTNRTTPKRKVRKRQPIHDYRVTQPPELWRSIPAGGIQEADNPRKRHLLAKLRTPRVAQGGGRCLCTLADGRQYWLKRDGTRTYLDTGVTTRPAPKHASSLGGSQADWD
jgi:hypothetical protein